jgi:hypothetical protein
VWVLHKEERARERGKKFEKEILKRGHGHDLGHGALYITLAYVIGFYYIS